ncbi:hypothetical protein H696_03223 [Fonticula alba]|uniref:Uncharacterized protein n=1 Tax=Fonticula alba TaxID=691883 RepID=A0A058ZA87_FONAL|nr:hypothetical protein H696_03223 [Fonticula alba]KCV70868.1 hypothetical protein H696_03223 [Fonticula alba]|eukprot:XP_009495384.1 hypothetical protein H696_03223 [Fonticula alba]
MALRRDDAFSREADHTASRAMEVDNIVAAAPEAKGDFSDTISILNSKRTNVHDGPAEAHTPDEVLLHLKTQMDHLSQSNRDTLDLIPALCPKPTPHPPPDSSIASDAPIAAPISVAADDRLAPPQTSRQGPPPCRTPTPPPNKPTPCLTTPLTTHHKAPSSITPATTHNTPPRTSQDRTTDPPGASSSTDTTWTPSDHTGHLSRPKDWSTLHCSSRTQNT